MATRRRTAALSTGIVTALVSPHAAMAAKQLDEMMGDSSLKAKMSIACGALEKSNCAQVLPRIAAQSSSKGLTLEAIASKGSIQSAEGVCKNVVQGALGQRDAFDQVQRRTECVNSFVQVGKALYPYYGYFVTLATASQDNVRDLVKNAPDGKVISVAVGKEGSGSQVTLSTVLKNVPEFKKVMEMRDQDPLMALEAMKSGALDALFIMDGPGSELIDEIKNRLGKDNKPLFKFLALDLEDSFYQKVQSWDRKPLYYRANLVAPGWLSSGKQTLAVDAVAIVSATWAKQDPNATKAARALMESMDAAEAAIRADVKVPKDWKSSAR